MEGMDDKSFCLGYDEFRLFENRGFLARALYLPNRRARIAFIPYQN